MRQFVIDRRDQRDLAVIHGFEEVGDVLWMRDRWLGRNVSFREQDIAFKGIWNTRRVVSAWVDQTGMIDAAGEMDATALARSLGASGKKPTP